MLFSRHVVGFRIQFLVYWAGATALDIVEVSLGKFPFEFKLCMVRWIKVFSHFFLLPFDLIFSPEIWICV